MRILVRFAFVSALVMWATTSPVFGAAAQRPSADQPPERAPLPSDLAPLRYDAAKLRSYPTATLVSFFARGSQELNAEAGNYPTLPLVGLPMQRHLVDVQAELVRRRPVDELLEAFEQPIDREQQAWMTWILQQISDPRVEPRMRTFARAGDDERSYLAAKFLAERGDTWALGRLNAGRFALSSGLAALQWAEEIALFGRYRYAPATLHLVDALEAGSLDVLVAALQSLKLIFPEARGRYDDVDDAHRYWRHFVTRFTWPPDCRVSEMITRGIALEERAAAEVPARNDAWTALLGAASAPSERPRFFVDARGRYLLAELCTPAGPLREGIHFFAVDGARSDFSWPEDGELRRLVCEASCGPAEACHYSLRSTDAEHFEVERVVEGERPRLVRFALAPGAPPDTLEQCACDYPC